MFGRKVKALNVVEGIAVICRWLGVDKVFLTENAAEPGTELIGSPHLEEFTKSGFLQLAAEPKPHAQLAVYNRCIQELRLQYNWIAFFDLDEILVVRECALLSNHIDIF